MTIPITDQTRSVLEEIQQHLTNGFAYSFTRNILAAGYMTEKQLPMYERLRAQLDNYYAAQHRVNEPDTTESIEADEVTIASCEEFDFSELDNFKFDIDEDNLFK